MREDDRQTYVSFLEAFEKGKTFLSVCDNCGEIGFRQAASGIDSKALPTSDNESVGPWRRGT